MLDLVFIRHLLIIFFCAFCKSFMHVGKNRLKTVQTCQSFTNLFSSSVKPS